MSLLLGFDERYLPAFGKNWCSFLFFGVALIILGLFAISAAAFTTILSVMVIGFVLLFSGIIIFVDTFSFWRRKGSGFFLHLLFAVLYLLVGIMLIAKPLESSISLTLVLGILYLVLGIFRLAFSPTLRTPKWGWGWFNGLITLLIGILIITSWPASSLYIIGLFVGVDLIFLGWAYVMAAIAARRHIK